MSSAVDVNLLSEDRYHINPQALSDASKEVGLKVHADKIEYMTVFVLIRQNHKLRKCVRVQIFANNKSK